MTTELEVFYSQSVLEVLPISQTDVVEIVTPGPQGPASETPTSNPFYINEGIRLVGYSSPYELALEIFDGVVWNEIFRYP